VYFPVVASILNMNPPTKIAAPALFFHDFDVFEAP
jgi:hypothetical protein